MIDHKKPIKDLVIREKWYLSDKIDAAVAGILVLVLTFAAGWVLGEQNKKCPKPYLTKTVWVDQTPTVQISLTECHRICKARDRMEKVK